MFILMFAFTFSLECQESIFVVNKVKGRFKKRTVYSHIYNNAKKDYLYKINKWQSIFDSNGYEVERNLCEDDKINFKIFYNYDTTMKLKEILLTGSDVNDIMIYKYNEYGKLVQIENCNEKNHYEGSTSFEYMTDETGNKFTFDTEYNQSGGRYSVSICKYNEHGDVIEANGLSQDFDHQSDFGVESYSYAFYKYKYDKHGNKIEMVGYDPDMTISFKITYKYDKYGNVIEQIKYNKSNEPQIKYEYIYSK